MGKKGKKGKDAEKKGPQRKLVVHASDMGQEMQDKVVAAANEAMATLKIEKDVATSVKKYMDDAVGGTWHCVVGKDFGCSICHEAKNSMFFQLDGSNVLLFRSQE